MSKVVITALMLLLLCHDLKIVQPAEQVLSLHLVIIVQISDYTLVTAVTQLTPVSYSFLHNGIFAVSFVSLPLCVLYLCNVLYRHIGTLPVQYDDELIFMSLNQANVTNSVFFVLFFSSLLETQPDIFS